MLSKWQPGEYCERCQNTGEVDCHCGGDLCVCGREEIECPRCHGRSAEPYFGAMDDDDVDYDGPAGDPGVTR